MQGLPSADGLCRPGCGGAGSPSCPSSTSLLLGPWAGWRGPAVAHLKEGRALGPGWGSLQGPPTASASWGPSPQQGCRQLRLLSPGPPHQRPCPRGLRAPHPGQDPLGGKVPCARRQTGPLPVRSLQLALWHLLNIPSEGPYHRVAAQPGSVPIAALPGGPASGEAPHRCPGPPPPGARLLRQACVHAVWLQWQP